LLLITKAEIFRNLARQIRLGKCWWMFRYIIYILF
jgi:hypothetical protein